MTVIAFGGAILKEQRSPATNATQQRTTVVANVSQSSTFPANNEEKERKEIEAPDKGPSTAKLGQLFDLGEYRYKIINAESRKTVGSGYSEKKASENAHWILVRYTIENLGKKTATVTTSDFLLRDKQEREFRTSSSGTTAEVMSSANKDMIVAELPPGIAREGVQVFELPESLTIDDIILVVPEKGWGSKKAYVVLKSE